MAHYEEPMDIDINSDFDNKENSIHHSNVYQQMPCTEKGYEELDVSELNMKLRYSLTPVSSPMSKSYTANCVDLKSHEPNDDIANANLTRSFNSTITRTQKSVKPRPLQSIITDHPDDNCRNSLIPIVVDSTASTVKGNEEILSIPSLSSSLTPSPSATTPTKDLPRSDGGSPIMRGLKTVLNMFRSSQSPIPPGEENLSKQDLSPNPLHPISSHGTQAVLSSTPISARRCKDDNFSKCNSPHKESIVFSEDLEKELLWKDETTILFSEEKIPIHKLLLKQPNIIDHIKCEKKSEKETEGCLNSSLEYMDVSYDKTFTDIKPDTNIAESEGEFLDCETTFTDEQMQKDNNISTDNKNKDQQCTDENKLFAGNIELGIAADRSCESNVICDSLHTPAKVKSQQNSERKNDDQPNVSENSNNTKPCSILNSSETRNQRNAPLQANDTHDNTVLKEIKTVNQNFPNNIFNDNEHQQLQNDKHEIIIPTPLDISKSDNLDNMFLKSMRKINECEGSLQEAFKTGDQNYVDTILSSNIDQQLSDKKEIFIPGISSNTEQVSDSNNLINNESYENITETNITKIQESAQGVHIECIQNDKHEIIIPTPLDISKSDNLDNVFLKSTRKINECEGSLQEAFKTDDQNYVDTILSSNIDQQLSDKKEIFIPGISSNTEQVSDSNNLINNESYENITETNITKIQESAQGVHIECIQNDKHELIIPTPLDISKSDNLDNMFLKSTRKINECEGSLQEAFKTDDQNYVDTILSSNIDQQPSDKKEIFIPGISSNTEQVSDSSNLINNESYENITETNITKIQESAQGVYIECILNSTADVTDTAISTNNNIGAEDLNATLILPHKSSINDTKEIIKICNESEASHNAAIETISNDISLTIDNPSTYVQSTEIRELLDSIQLLNESYISDRNKESMMPKLDMSVDMQTNSETNTCILKHQSKDIILLNDAEKEIATTDLFHLDETLEDSPTCDLDINFAQIKSDNLVALQGEIENGLTTFIEKVDTSAASNDDDKTKVSAYIQEKPLPDLLHSSNDKLNINLKNDCDSVTKQCNVTNKCCKQESEEQIVNRDEIKNNIDAGMLPEKNTPVSNSYTEIIQPHPEHSDIANYSSSKTSKKSPNSQKMLSKEYNFNFEEIVDPFATKTKIRLSPPLDSPNKNSLAKDIKSKTNEFKFQLENKITETALLKETDVISLKADHSTLNNELDASEFSNKTISLDNLINNIDHVEHTSVNRYDLEVKDKNIAPSNIIETNVVDTVLEQNTLAIDNNLSSMESITNSIHATITSSSEQSAYFSVATSSCESGLNKNVFNIPEIDDTNLNLLTKKSQTCFSHQYAKGENVDINLNTKDEIVANEEMNVNENQECINISNITSSSKATEDKDITVREVDTEDEDTIEGPFFGAEDIESDDKMPVFDCDDDNLMQFTDLPMQESERNIESDELFIDAEAFEFLLNQNQTNVITNSGKESLFLKFDPLFARRVSNDGVLASLKNVQKKQFTPRKKTVAQQINITFEKPGPSTLNLTHEYKADSTLDVTTDAFNTKVSESIMPAHPADSTLEVTTDDLNTTVSKPMMVVPPAVNPIVTLKNKPATPVNSNRRSITFTSPAIAVIDRLLSLSGNNSLLGEDSTVMQTNRDQNEADIALTQLRELLAEKELHVYTLRSESNELKDRLSLLESQMRLLETESENRLKKINELTETLTEKSKINKNMAAVVEEYERTIASLIAETEQDKKRHNEERIKLMKERDEQTAHLASMEVSFSDIHSKYEKSKQIILSCKANEDAYKKSIKDFEENLSKMQSNYELLKQHATSKLNHANQELEKMNRAHDAEVLKLNAMIKRKDLHITSLEETLAQKTKANEELTAICDELINKVG